MAGRPGNRMSDGSMRDASVLVARDANKLIALLSAHFPAHGGQYLFLSGGRRENGETPLDHARRELSEEAGVTAQRWTCGQVRHGLRL
ncbi:NUDIX hydrolase [Streptomyces sp. NPDC005281]|uniref:NUDIX hydrolase n=1 Tax=Streptomyces sp. NPDC005281 TaxID=3155712 RepID=UPI0033A07AAE